MLAYLWLVDIMLRSGLAWLVWPAVDVSADKVIY